MGRSGGEAVRCRPERGQAIERYSYLLSLCPRSFRSTRRSLPPGLWDALQPHAENAVYVNYLGPDDGEDRIREAYGDVSLRAPEGAEARLRPGQRLPQQPEHLAGLASEPGFDHRVARSEALGDRIKRGERGRPLDGIVDGASREPRVRRVDARSACMVCPRVTAIWSSRAD